MGWVKSLTKAGKKAGRQIEDVTRKAGGQLEDVTKKAGSQLEDTILNPVKKAAANIDPAQLSKKKANLLAGIAERAAQGAARAAKKAPLRDLDPTKMLKKAGSALEDTILNPIKKAGVQIEDATRNVGSQFEDVVINPVKKAGVQLEDATKKAGSALRLDKLEDAARSAGSWFEDKVLEPIAKPFAKAEDDLRRELSNFDDQVLQKIPTPMKVADEMLRVANTAYKAEDLVRKPEEVAAPVAPIAPTMPSMDSEAIARARRRQLAAAMMRGGRTGTMLTGQSETLGG